MFAADNVKVPVSPAASPLVSVPATVAIGSATVMLPAPTTVNAYAPLNALPDDTSNVNVPEELPTVAAALSDTRLVTELLFAVFNNAPEPEPLPLIVKGSATVKPPDSDNAAPDDTVVPVPEPPNDELFVITTTPAETVVAPV